MAKLDQVNYKGTIAEIVPEIAPLFKTTETYAAGDHVIYEADWYTFKEAKEAGAWDATKVDGPFKVANEIVSLKEDLSTLNTEGTVPTSEQMLSENVTVDSVPYHFRKTASDNADREELEIVGGSVAWNQQIIGTDSATNWVAWKMSLASSDGAIVATAQEDNINTMSVRPNAVNVIQGHKYLLDAYLMTSEATSWTVFTINETGFTNWIPLVANTWTRVQVINSAYATSTLFRIFADQAGGHTAGFTLKIKNYMLFDLTAMFGSTIADHIYSLEQATAGAGVALFRSLFNKDYYAYDADSIQSVSGLSEHKMVGFNQFDASTIMDGKVVNGRGEVENAPGAYCSDFIKVLPYTEYYTNADATGAYFTVRFFDENKQYHRSSSFTVASTFNTESDCYIRINSVAALMPPSALMVNISDPSKNGTYEPYDGHSYALDDSLTLRGIPTLVDGKLKFDGDIYPPSGLVEHKYGEVVLNGTQPTGVFTSGVSGEKLIQVIVPGLANVGANDIKVISDKLVSVSENTIWVNAAASIATHGDATAENRRIWLRVGTTITTDAEAVTWLQNNPVTVVYPLATPTTETADPYIGIQSCDPNGTEEFVSTGIVPVGHNTKYPDNMRAKLDGLPWNFASLIAPTESGYTATRNYTTGALLIVNNVLYKATANIANGATITPNTNVTATTLAEVIAAL